MPAPPRTSADGDGITARVAARLEEAFRHEPDPAGAVRRAQAILQASAAALAEAGAADEERCLAALRALAARAPFFARILERHPAWLAPLVTGDLAAPRSLEDYRAGLGATLDAMGLAEARGPEVEPALRRFKYRELARITVRECSPERVPLERVGEVLAELSHLAEALLERACALASARVEARRGPPVWRTASGAEEQLGFCVLGLGKLGSEELNYSSDVDLVYLHASPSGPVSDGPGGLAPAEYFTAVGQEFGGMVSRTSAEGFLYRVDLELRPEGGAGPLVVSEEALVGYYEAWAAAWEKAAFMKARPVAGDRALGWRALRAVAPVLYRSSRDWGAVEGIRQLKHRVENEHGRRARGFHVKSGPGGIRDVEFVAQALQMLHGGRMPQVRARGTEQSLRLLAEVDVLPAERARALLDAYRFLRRLENRLQMEAERQTHLLPEDAKARVRVARALGYGGDDGAAAFEADLERHRGVARTAFEDFDAREGTERILDLFHEGVPQLLARPETRGMLEQLAGLWARAVEDSNAPERALLNLERFVEGVGSRRFYYELLIDRPELVRRLTGLFATSSYLSSYLASHPRLIEPVFDDPAKLALSLDELREDLAAIRAELRAGDDVEDAMEAELDALRLFHHRHVLNVGLLDLDGKLDLASTERALSDLAEACLEGALTLARREEAERAQADGEGGGPAAEAAFLVVAMGKLGTRELSYGSDLDVIFLFEPPDGADESDLAEVQYACAKLAQRVISILSTRTREGTCYEVDARLRPSGSQGVLVTSLASFRRYHGAGEQGAGSRSTTGRAQVWERQALLRARPLPFGDGAARRLAEGFEATRRGVLESPLPEDAAGEIRRIRQRMESELARETRSRRDFKLGRGGLSDIETAVQYLQLRHGAAHPALFEPEPLEKQLERLAERGLLDARAAAALGEGLSFLKRLGSRLRIVENRSISDLDHERGDLDALARSLGYAAGEREGGARRALLADYRRHTAAIRDAYDTILRAGTSEDG